MPETRNVNRFIADVAMEVLEQAKDNGDQMVANACRNVLWGRMLARPVAQTDIDVVREFGRLD